MSDSAQPVRTTLESAGVSSESPQAGSFRELLAVAIPLVLSSGSISLMIAIDRLFLTWYSEDALAACTPAAALHWTVMSTFIGLINYANAFVAQYEGAGRRDRVVASVWQAAFLSVVAGALFLALLPWTSYVFDLVGHAPEVRRLETKFFRTLCLGAVPMLLTMAFGAFYSGRGKTRVVMYIDFLLAATNIALDPLLIFGIWPFPRLGIVGAALATDTAYTVAVLVYIILSFRGADAKAYHFWKHVRFDKELFGRLLRYGLPTGLQMAAELSAFSVFLFLVGRLGTQQLAATNLALNINMLSFIPMVGVGTAVMTLVGRRIGEGRAALAERTTWLAARSVATYMLLFSVLFVVIPETILLPFTGWHAGSEMSAIRDEVVILLRFVAVYTFFDGMAIVFAYAIRGAGDTRFPFVYTLITSWTIMVLPTYFMISTGRGGLFAAWSMCAAYICLLGTSFFFRFLNGKWKSMNIIGAAALEPTERTVDPFVEPVDGRMPAPLAQSTSESD
jgi:multidrug resistance protein, MATE family